MPRWRIQTTADGAITDNNTGLMWEKLSDDGTIHDKDNLYTWDDAFAAKVATLNSGSFAGHSNWRLPNVKELESIVNYEMGQPAISTAFNANCAPGCTVETCSCTNPAEFFNGPPGSGAYWSSDTVSTDVQVAWTVHYYFGNTNGVIKTHSFFVRAVRGGS